MAIGEQVPSIEVITGPTASGKSLLALKRANADPTIEIVNADAFQVYRGFDIGTAKPTPEERQKIKHHLIDILAPHESYSAGQYARDARAAIEDILSRGSTPLVVGGTGLYIDALFFGISSTEVDKEAKEAARERYRQELETLGFAALHEMLQPIDPLLYAQIARERNPIRLERAWIHYYTTGIALGEAHQNKPEAFRYSPHVTVLMPDKEDLRERIARRVDAMLDSGWLDEVRSLLALGVVLTMPAMRAIGYTELAGVIENTLTLANARDRIINRTRQYAKRQMTWMKRYLNQPLQH